VHRLASCRYRWCGARRTERRRQDNYGAARKQSQSPCCVLHASYISPTMH